MPCVFKRIKYWIESVSLGNGASLQEPPASTGEQPMQLSDQVPVSALFELYSMFLTPSSHVVSRVPTDPVIVVLRICATCMSSLDNRCSWVNQRITCLRMTNTKDTNRRSNAH